MEEKTYKIYATIGLTLNDLTESEQPIVLTLYKTTESDDSNMQEQCLLNRVIDTTDEVNLFINQLFKQIE